MTTSPDHLDVLVGARPMALALFGQDDKKTCRRVMYWLERGFIKAKKVGGLYTIPRHELLAQFSTLDRAA